MVIFKKLILGLFISLSFAFVCLKFHEQSNEQNFIGTWGSCINGGKYCELHFFEDFYVFHIDNDILDYNVGRYLFLNDSIMLIAIQLEKIEVGTSKVDTVFVNLSSDSIFYSQGKKGGNLYYRVDHEPLLNFKLGTLELEKLGYMNNFLDRKNAFKCSHL